MMMLDDYCIRVIDLPCSVRAMVVYDVEGFPSVYVNARLSYEEQRKALRHELRHIRRDDVYNDKDIRSVER